MKFGDFTYEEIHDYARQDWLAVVPTGCTEQQGPHLPVDFDTWFAEKVCLAASEKAARDSGVRSLVLPAMPFGPTPEHKNYGSGYIDIPKDLHEALYFSVLTSLAEQGFQRIVVWRGCGQHDFVNTIARFNDEYSGKSKAYLPDLPYHDIWMRIGDPDNPGGHADSFTTSIMLYLRPELVHRDKIINPNHSKVDWRDPNLDFSRYSTTGVIGDPTAASAELGKKLWEAIITEVARIFKGVAVG
jgi:creatinine amidohydrolase